jgi:peptidoglycan LD-endopeptidase LytH
VIPILIKPLLCAFLAACTALPSFASPDDANPAEQWHLLYPRIRDRLIPKEQARRTLQELESSLKAQYPAARNTKQATRLLFPLKGYDSTSIGGKKGSGYKPQEYDFFDGRDHKGHPGHDLFIRDRDQDGLDDLTRKPVTVLSASPGVVVSINTGWEPSSSVRGGNYIWIYEPATGRYFYYAHLNEISIKLGQSISTGDFLGTVGRTGQNAYPKRSPTHLHFTVHHSESGSPTPLDPYPEWVKAKQ